MARPIRSIHKENSGIRLGIEGLLVQASLQGVSVVSLSKTHYPLLSTGSSQEDLSQHD